LQEFGLDEFRRLEAKQQPTWPDSDVLASVTQELSKLPPLVFAGEVDTLRQRLAQAAQGKAFLLQGGDCAETFVDATADRIRNRIKTVLQMAVVLMYGSSLPVIKMGRMAGQFAKPRSSDTETREGVTLPAYRGDAVNGYEFTAEARANDPKRLLGAYHTSASTLNLIRAFTTGGFADLRQVHAWNKGFTDNPANKKYESIAGDIDRAMRFMEACGVDSAHFIWIGERTRDLSGAHVDFFSRVRNPIGVKLGPGSTKEQVLALIEKLDPDREPGRLTLISRMGAEKIRGVLPDLVEAVRDSGANPLWITDPMHGNGITTKNGYKSRRFDDVLDEVTGFFEVHRALGTHPGGLHVELTGDDVAECLGGSEQIDESTLEQRYESVCDPRLNHMQSLELAFLVAEQLVETTRRKGDH